MIRHILARIDGTERDAAVLAHALAAVRRFGAHVEALHVRFDPTDIPVATGYGAVVGIASLIETMAATADQAEAAARRAYQAWRDGNGLREAVAPDGSGEVSVGLTVATGHAAEIVARLGRLSDLIVTARPSAKDGASSLPALEAALFDAGRPVLAVSGGDGRALFGRPVIAWNGSREAARAVAGALPVLAAASHTVGVFLRPEVRRPAEADDLVRYLAWHGISAMPLHQAGTASDDASLRSALEGAGDLVVMGAYTRGVWRQAIFGGLTRTMIFEATVPVLMAH